jgi:hypothetical protein
MQPYGDKEKWIWKIINFLNLAIFISIISHTIKEYENILDVGSIIFL